MRTRPLPQRHAYDLSLFAETIQATLNRNKAKGDLAEMSFQQIMDKLEEEYWELTVELAAQGWRERQGLPVKYRRVEHEACDLAVCALAAFIKARGLGNG